MGYPYYPTSRAVEVFQVDSEQFVPIFPVNNGATVMMIDRNDAFIAVKAVGLDGTPAITYYDKRPPAAPAPAFDPSAYVTKDELDERLASLKKKKEAAE